MSIIVEGNFAGCLVAYLIITFISSLPVYSVQPRFSYSFRASSILVAFTMKTTFVGFLGFICFCIICSEAQICSRIERETSSFLFLGVLCVTTPMNVILILISHLFLLVGIYGLDYDIYSSKGIESEKEWR